MHLIKTAFKAIPHENKVLLAPGWKTQRRTIKWIRLREWMYRWDLFRAKKNNTFRTNLGFVKEEDAQYYLNASDILLIPRIDELNSGNITLGCTFGLVVMGRDGGDIGEILKATANPVFNPKNPTSIHQAVIKALELIDVGHGFNNKKIALKDWDIDMVSNMYYNFYKETLKQKGF